MTAANFLYFHLKLNAGVTHKNLASASSKADRMMH